jgi:Tfp pilus assembly protein PilV
MRSISCAGRSRARDQAGASMIEFLAVTILTVVCLLALAQMAVWVWA